MCNERNMQTNTLKNKKKTNHIKWNHTCLNSFQFSSVTICLRRISSETKERNSKKVKSRLDIFKRQAKQENCKYYFVIKNIRSTHSKSIPRSNKIKVKKKKKLLGNKKTMDEMTQNIMGRWILSLSLHDAVEMKSYPSTD